MSQRNIEIVIGRLLTDEEFRQGFLTDPRQSLRDLLERGTHLTDVEIAALISTDRRLWRRVADQIDARLQRASLKSAFSEDRPSGSTTED